MDGEWWEPDFSLLEWEGIDKPGQEARMIHVIMKDDSRRHHNQLYLA